MAQETGQGRGFKLEIPIDASTVEDFKPDLAVRALIVNRAGKTYSKATKLDNNGSALVAFDFPDNPGSLRLILGPESASDEELLNLQTISLQVPLNRAAGGALRLPPIIISPYYW